MVLQSRVLENPSPFVPIAVYSVRSPIGLATVVDLAEEPELVEPGIGGYPDF